MVVPPLESGPIADSSQLGTSQRVEKKVMKMWTMNQASLYVRAILL